jgi:hypothetical protein
MEGNISQVQRIGCEPLRAIIWSMTNDWVVDGKCFSLEEIHLSGQLCFATLNEDTQFGVQLESKVGQGLGGTAPCSSLLQWLCKDSVTPNAGHAGNVNMASSLTLGRSLSLPPEHLDKTLLIKSRILASVL